MLAQRRNGRWPAVHPNRWVHFKPLSEDMLGLNVKEDLNNWVADLLYRSIYFAGVGLSESELGLW